MAARVIHFGWDDCYRVQVLRYSGYADRESVTLDALRLDQELASQVDAVILSEDDRRSMESAAGLVRQYSEAPMILFRRFQDGLDETQFDRVFTPFVPPLLWLSETACLIAACKALGETSARLRHEAREAVLKTTWERARSRAESKRNANHAGRWRLEDTSSGKEEDRD